MFVIPICPTHGEAHAQKALKLLKDSHIGGVIFMGGTLEAQKKILQAIDPSVLAFQDAEWGVGMRLKDVPPLPKNLTLGAIQDVSLLRAFGRELARQCRHAGLCGNFAPVADCNSNPQNPVIGARSFGDNPEEVKKRAVAVFEGMQEGGILACAKHFPGHGDTIFDSHLFLPKIQKNLEALEATELIPFRGLIEAGIDLVMIGHLVFPELSQDPASLSYEVITELLRKQLGFEGVVITDALNMRALAKYSMEEIVNKTLMAGTDLLLFAASNPVIVEQLLDKIPKAIEHILATIPEDLLDEKIARMSSLKRKRNVLLPEENKLLCRTLFQHAVTLLGKPPFLSSPLILIQSHPDPIFRSFLEKYTEVVCLSYEEMDLAQNFSNIVVQIGPNDFPKTLPEHAIIALFDAPYKLAKLPSQPTVVGYENVFFAKEAVADVLFGKIPALGKLPIQVYDWGYGKGK